MTSSQIRQSFLDFFREREHSIVSSSSLMPDSPNLLFTNAGMNQFVPIFLGQQKSPYTPGRAADTQKCIRAGGKHNDLEDVGLDTYHHTFFEMLGNWSFGDYFKAEAVDWAWDLITGVWGFPPSRLYATVYQPGPGDPSEYDQEAADLWSTRFAAAGLDPKRHVVPGNKKDNFWMMGETGPCGPCSELHVDLTPGGDTRGALVNKGTAECIEIWNLVFIQYNANADGSFSPLPARHVDTGMGFERVTAIMQGTKGFKEFNRPVSNYDSDIFQPLFRRLEQLCGVNYGGTLPDETTLHHRNPKLQADIAFRVIADHARTLSFAIADGIHPGNTDRHYVLRRILRRAVRYGRSLGLHDPFFYRLVDVLSETMGDVFPELRQRRQHVEEVIRLEEEAFNRTLDRGIDLFQEEAARVEADNKVVMPGDFAFKLYDTYGFPLDLTQLMARERGMEVEPERFEELMAAQRDRARKAQKREVIELSEIGSDWETNFCGFDQHEAAAKVLDVVKIKNRAGVITDASPFYAEMGGQVGDTGEIDHGGRLWMVTDTQKAGSAWLHFLEDSEDVPLVGEEVVLRLDRHRRQAIERHHSVTHLLHWALHEVVSREIGQKGSQVNAAKLTFDFNGAALTSGQLADVERLVNERILENGGVSWTEVEHASVKGRADVMQFFGDKYGERVRVVQMGGSPGALDGYSMELCGGTHVRATGEIGLFRILSEGAIAAGVRRIEAVAGLAAREALVTDHQRLQRVAGMLNAPLAEIEKKVEATLHRGRELEKALLVQQQREAGYRALALLDKRQKVGEVEFIAARIEEATGEDLQRTAEALKGRCGGVIVLAGACGGKVHVLVSVGSDLQKTLPAGKILQRLIPTVSGRGGGKADVARGAGTDASGIGPMLEQVSGVLQAGV